MTIDIRTGPACECPPDHCREYVDEDYYTCVNRLGDCVTLQCDKCATYTWHHENKCLRCEVSQ